MIFRNLLSGYCTQKGDAATPTNSSYIGGVCGYSTGGATIQNCYIYNFNSTWYSQTKFAYAGGVVGRALGTRISLCYLGGTATITSVGTDRSYAGGVVGYFGASTQAKKSIEYCDYNGGRVTAGSSSVSQISYSAGIVGYLNYGDVNHCKATCEVSYYVCCYYNS